MDSVLTIGEIAQRSGVAASALPIPDANTTWTFREALTKACATLRLFELFDQELRAGLPRWRPLARSQ
jgi:hypothetical protein